MATLAAVAALLTLTPGFAIAEALTNAEIVELTKAGLGPDAILAKIQTSANAFDTSTQQLLVLKRQGVPDVVIAAMLRASSGAIVSSNAVGNSTSADPRSPHASGIYMIDDDVSPPQMQHIDPTVGSGSKTSGVLAYAFTYGIAPVKIKTVIPNASARVRSRSGHPTFYFYFNQTDTQLSGNGIAGVWLPGAVTSPSEFSLVRFEVAHGSRETELGQFNLTGLKSGVMDKARVAFSYDDVAPGVFKVAPTVELRPGQYGFVYSTTGAGAGFGGMPGARIFDFAVVADDSDRAPPREESPTSQSPPAAAAPPKQTASKRRCALRTPTDPSALTC